MRSASPAGPRVTLRMSFGRCSNLPEANVATNEPDRLEPSVGCPSDSNEEVDCEARQRLRMNTPPTGRERRVSRGWNLLTPARKVGTPQQRKHGCRLIMRQKGPLRLHCDQR